MIAFFYRSKLKLLPSFSIYPTNEDGRGSMEVSWLIFTIQYFSKKSEEDASLASFYAYRKFDRMDVVMNRCARNYKKRKRLLR